MNLLEHYTPDDIPPEIKVYETEPIQLGLGKAGKVGNLLLEFDGESGRTVLKKSFSQVPLFVQRALYLEESLPNMAYVYLISPSEGILQGDRYRIDISLKNNACAHLTTQSATKIYSMNCNYATQVVNVNVDENCYFEFIPDQIIPYRNSRFYQRIDLRVHDNATMVYSEIVTPGRVASGESFEYDACYLKTAGKNQDNTLRFTDVAVLEPKRQNLRRIGLLEDFDVVGSVYMLTAKEHTREVKEELDLAFDNFQNVSCGATIMPRDCGVMARGLGNTAGDVRQFIFECVKTVRKLVLHARFSGLRKY